MTKYSLITGSTGLVGRYLLRDMLLNGHHLALIVRPSRRESAEQRIEGICQFWEREIGKSLPRPVVLAGNLSDPMVGMTEEDRKWISKHCDRIIHSAAILEFFGKDREREPWRTNVGGTQNVIDLCRETGLTEMHYISTAYVAGTREERIMEEDLAMGQSFRNDYEESKFEAEELIRKADCFDQPTVYRPAVIAGDFKTGYTSTYHGIYLYLRLLAMIVPELPLNEDGLRSTPVKLNMTGREKRNIIPVDWVSEVTSRLVDMPEARGKTFHLAPEDPITAGEIIEACASYFKTTGYEYCGDDPNFDPDDQEDFGSKLIPNFFTYQAYERTDNTYDLTNLKSLLPDLPAPKIDEKVMHRFIEYGEQDKWGKARGPKVEVPFSVTDYLAEKQSPAAASESTVGLDVSGPGGGQFTVSAAAGQIGCVERGLPIDDAVPVLRLEVAEFAELCDPAAGSSVALQNHWHGEADARVTDLVQQALFPAALASSEKQQ